MIKKKILIVEDEAIVAKDIQMTLERIGYGIAAIVSFGEEAVEKAGELAPDLVLMDIVLKGEMDGIQAASEIHKHSNVPIIYLTAYSDEITLQKAKLTYPYGYIIKPFEKNDLKIAIEIALYKSDMENKLIESRRKEEKEKSKTLRELRKAYKNLKSTHEQLIQSEKMAGLGQLSAGIAHEFNNLLGIMSGYVQLARRTQTREDMLEALCVVSSTTERAAKIIKSLMFFSAKKTLKVEFYDIRLVVDRVITLVESQLEKKNIQIVKQYEDVEPIKLNAMDIQQVFLNIIVNARDSMLTRGGVVKIGIKKEGKFIVIDFSDTGVGVSGEFQGRVFEPFFTTKGALGGSEIPGIGLGLSISYSIVKRHGGTIKVRNNEGKGATFTVKLPVKGVKKAEIFSESKRIKRSRKKTKLNILVVDDEEEICRMLIRYLTIENHKVRAVNSGKEAIKIVNREEFDFILLDLLMPGIRGVSVLKSVKKISPQSRVILMTGNMEKPGFIKHIKKEGAYAYMEKPFQMEKVVDIINSI